MLDNVGNRRHDARSGECFEGSAVGAEIARKAKPEAHGKETREGPGTMAMMVMRVIMQWQLIEPTNLTRDGGGFPSCQPASGSSGLRLRGTLSYVGVAIDNHRLAHSLPVCLCLALVQVATQATSYMVLQLCSTWPKDAHSMAILRRYSQWCRDCVWRRLPSRLWARCFETIPIKRITIVALLCCYRAE